MISEEIITIDDFDLEDSGKILKTQGYDNIDYKYILKNKFSLSVNIDSN